VTRSRVYVGIVLIAMLAGIALCIALLTEVIP
jgi:hypothetical protein